MRRSRGARKRAPDHQLSQPEQSEREASVPAQSTTTSIKPETDKKPPEVMKSRIESWLKDAEEDAEKAEKYLDKKKEKKALAKRDSDRNLLAAASSRAKQTDVIKALEVVEDASAKSEKRKKTPPDMSQEERRRLVQELGRKPSQEKVSLYVKSTSQQQQEAAAAAAAAAEKEQTTKARQLIESVARRSVDVPTDILLKPIREDNEER